jgi:hypothetical protein
VAGPVEWDLDDHDHGRVRAEVEVGCRRWIDVGGGANAGLGSRPYVHL